MGYMDYVELVSVFDAVNLNIPVPFKAGDIIEFDGFPFGPRFRALILKVGDNRDCCCVQGLALNEEGRWTVGAVKHGHVGPQYYPMESLLYSARPYIGELDDKEKVINEISQIIAGKEEIGGKIWSTLTNNGVHGMSENDLRNALRDWLLQKSTE